MRYIKIFSSDSSDSLQIKFNWYVKETKHEILDQTSAVSIAEFRDTLRERYLLTVTFDDGVWE